MEGGLEFHQQQQLSCKFVPWLRWEEWNFVRESLFSSSPHSIAAALRRVSAWRARGRLPVPIEVTAAFVEIQQKDPFFRDGLADDTLNSDEILAMSYCMAIMRLVNGFLDKSCNEAKLSISQSAEVFGIPRVLVDIRHEGSHRDLPSLPLVRSASLKALDWLKSSYWEPQRNLIPNVRKETESRMHEMVLCLNPKNIQRQDSCHTKRKRVKQSMPIFGRGRLFPRLARLLHSKCGDLPSKGMLTLRFISYHFYNEADEVLLDESQWGPSGWMQACRLSIYLVVVSGWGRGLKGVMMVRNGMSCSWTMDLEGFKKKKNILGSLIRLYSVSPSEVVAVLLEFPLKTFDSFGSIEAEKCSGDIQAETNSSDSMCCQCTIEDWKAIITRLASKEPALLLTMLEEVLVMIETREAMRFEMGEIHLPSVQYWAQIRQIECLCSLIPWLLRNMIESKDSGSTQSANGSHSSTTPNAMLSELLRKCLLLLTPSNTNRLDSALLLAKIMGNNSITKRLKKLQLKNAPSADQTIEDTTDDLDRALLQQEDSIKRVAKKLEFLKSCQRKGKTVISETANEDLERKTWTVAKSWSKCPIGMLPRTFGSSGVLPDLESPNTLLQENKNPVEDKEFFEKSKCSDKREPSWDLESLENSAVKKMRETVLDDGELPDCQDQSFLTPIKGQLLIDGVWKKVEEEDLVAIVSGVRIFV